MSRKRELLVILAGIICPICEGPKDAQTWACMPCKGPYMGTMEHQLLVRTCDAHMQSADLMLQIMQKGRP